MNSAATIFCDPFVFTYKTPFMQRIADLVRSGHTQYVLGTIPTEKAGLFAGKMDSLLHISRNKLQACRARKLGEASARLLFLQQANEKHLTWILLRNPGDKADQSGQDWRDALEDKITITGYELVRRTRPDSKKPAWTWRYTQNQYDLVCESIISSIRGKRDLELQQLIHSLVRSPGFAGVRDHVTKMCALISAEWKRRRAKSEAMPEIPRHGYTRRLEDAGCRLSELKAFVRDQRKPAKKVKPTVPVTHRRRRVVSDGALAA